MTLSADPMKTLNANQASDTHRNRALKLAEPFSPALTAFLDHLIAIEWRAQVPSCLFIRDFEDLPYSAPFDIDLLCAQADWPALLEQIGSAATQNGLIVSHHASSPALHVLVVDVTGPLETRRHAYFEVRTVLDLPARQFAIAPASGISLTSESIPHAAESGLPVPTPDWHCAFLLLQALRKRDHAKYLRRVMHFEVAQRHAACELLISEFGFSRNALAQWLEAPTPRIASTESNGAPLAGTGRLRTFCANRLFFLPLLKLDFFTIHGPDGVGKSTTCDEIARLFDGLPFGLYQFHHSEGWKSGRQRNVEKVKPVASASSHHESPAPSWPRRIARGIYRWLPQPLKEAWLWNSHFVNYNRKFTRFLLDNRNAGNIMFADRYIYDVRVKYIIETAQPSWVARSYYRLHCLLVPKPRFGFLLVDEPAAIVARKNELTETQVSQFIFWIKRVLNQRRMPYEVIPVASRTPSEVASEIAQKLISLEGNGLIAHMRMFVTRLEALDAAETDAHNGLEPDMLRSAV